MAGNYESTSPYVATPMVNGHLDVLKYIPIPSKIDDVQFTITTYYMHRPDLLANDLYGTSKLWWVFAARNLEVIQDSVYDFIPGQTIFLPQLTTINTALGS